MYWLVNYEMLNIYANRNGILMENIIHISNIIEDDFHVNKFSTILYMQHKYKININCWISV